MLAVVRNSDNRVVAILPDSEAGRSPAGMTQIPLPDPAPEVLGLQWTGGLTFVVIPKPPRRQITAEQFWDRWTDDEAVKLEELSEANTNAGRQVRAFFRATQLAGAVDLDKPWLVTKLGQLSTLMIADGIWVDQATADARVAALLADG